MIMEAGLHDNGVDNCSRNGEESKVSEELDSRGQKGGGGGSGSAAEKKQNDDVTVDIKEALCRICQLSDDDSSDDSQLITLGCDCKGELGFSHRSCATAWFLQKKNRICEICGKTAENISGDEMDGAMLMMEMNEMRLVIEALDHNNSSRSCKISFCNFMLIWLVLAFFLPWFFRGIEML